MATSGAAISLRTVTAIVVCCLVIVAGARFAPAALLTRGSIERDGPVAELHFALTGRPGWASLSRHGSQLWIDLDNTKMVSSRIPIDGRLAPPVDLVRVFSPHEGVTRVVIEVNQRCEYVMARTARALTIRIAPSGTVANLAAPLRAKLNRDRPTAREMPLRSRTALRHSAPAPAGSELAALAPPAPIVPAPSSATGNRNREPRPIVMIDPGHGGFDSGTAAAAPLLEKNLALAISRQLAQALKQRGIDARLTRDGDYFLTLADRTRLANQSRADLFVSIHLNSSPDPNANGIETYYLDNTTDRATIRLARIENAAGGVRYSASRAVDLNYILSDLRQNYKAAESASVADMVEAQTVAMVNSGLGLRVRDLGARKGPFYVLVGARMPSLLVECGFLSNKTEAARLASDRYQTAIAAGIADAIVHCFNADAAVGNL
ncbi:MAG: N-acetylmuramoyl-L-alanine amidase [Candidatus Binataceae bacterium]|nr:N-acetylmuramoyl-L-alanine amidase [Candidatus Binataceae bacterium]